MMLDDILISVSSGVVTHSVSPMAAEKSAASLLWPALAANTAKVEPVQRIVLRQDLDLYRAATNLLGEAQWEPSVLGEHVAPQSTSPGSLRESGTNFMSGVQRAAEVRWNHARAISSAPLVLNGWSSSPLTRTTSAGWAGDVKPVETSPVFMSGGVDGHAMRLAQPLMAMGRWWAKAGQLAVGPKTPDPAGIKPGPLTNFTGRLTAVLAACLLLSGCSDKSKEAREGQGQVYGSNNVLMFRMPQTLRLGQQIQILETNDRNYQFTIAKSNSPTEFVPFEQMENFTSVSFLIGP